MSSREGDGDTVFVADAFKPPDVERIVIWHDGPYDREGEPRDVAPGAPFFYDNTAADGGGVPPWIIEGWLVEVSELDDGRLRVEMEVTRADCERIAEWQAENDV